MPWDNNNGFSIGPWWARFTIGPYGNGWSFYAFRRRLAWRPIDYSKTRFVQGRRVWGLPRIAGLDLRKNPKQ